MSLKPLNKIASQDLVNLDSVSIKEDTVTRMTTDPEWNELWNPDIEQNAFQMILNTFADIGEKVASHANINIREKFLNQAYAPQSIYDNLNNNFISLQQPTASVVDVLGILQNDILQEPLIIPRFTQLTGYNANNESAVFEFILKDENGKYKYFDNILFYPNSTFTDHVESTLYAGQTTSLEYVITDQMKSNFIISLNIPDIIEDSIQVYFMGSTPIELPQTSTFSVAPDILPFYFPNGKPHYVVQYKADGSANLLFGSAEFGGAFEDSHVGSTLIVFCRYGGGTKTNIPINGISQVIKLSVSGGRNITVKFQNPQAASGGKDREDIYKAQAFAPYRYGRGRAIIDANDIMNQIYSLVVKHEVDTPEYDEVDRTVPILHALHRVVYKRDFSSYTVPEHITDETLAEYKTRFLASINEYCNITGIRDSAIQNEDVTTFVYPDSSGYTLYNYAPIHKYPISGSLKAIAYDYRGTAVDSITWKTNYIVDSRSGVLSKSATPSEHTTLLSNNFSSITVIVTSTGRNDLFNIRFDYEKRPYTFELQLTAGIKTPAMLAAELQFLIQTKITEDAPEYFIDARTWIFVTYEMLPNSTEGHLIITSPSFGYDSTIEIVDNGTPDSQTDPNYNLYLFLGFSKKIYRPASETGLVFDANNFFNYEQNTINFEFKNTRYDKTYSVTEASLGLIVNHSTQVAPLINYILYGENKDFVEKLFEGYDLFVTAYNNLDKPVDHMIFASISSTTNNPGTPGDGTEFLPDTYTPGSIFKDSVENKFEYSTSKINIRCIDNVLTPYYEQTYPTVYRVDLVKILEDPLNPGVYVEDPSFTPIQFLEVNNNYTHNNAIITGKTCILTLTALQNSLLISGLDYMIKFYHRTGTGDLELKETAKILNLVVGAVNALTDLPILQLVIDQAFMNNEYDNTARTIKWKFVDGTLDPAVIYYDRTYGEFSYIKSVFKRKTYDNVKLQYSPNVYYTEGEAKGIIDIISSKKNRLIALEHIMHSTDFQPMPLSVQLLIRKTYSLNNAIDAVMNLLTSMFGYSNVNSDVTIGTRITHQLIKNTIQSIAADYGILDITISSAEIQAINHAADMYHFILDYSVFQQLRDMEFRYEADLVGLADSYKFVVTAVTEGVQ